METQLIILNIIILMALFMAVAFLVLKSIIYLNEIKLAESENVFTSNKLGKEKIELELEKSKVDLENAKLLMQYAEFVKSNGGEGGVPGYASVIKDTFEKIDKQK